MKTDHSTSNALALSKHDFQRNSNLSKDQLKYLNKPSVGSGPDYKLELSSTPRTDASSPKTELPNLNLPTASVPVVKPPSLNAPDISVKDAVKDVASDKVKKEAAQKIKEIKNDEPRDGSLKKPAIFFIKGLDLFSSPSKSEGGYAGVGKMAEAIEGARIYSWDQKDEIIKQIKKTHKDFPIVLVGHSLGGDTAVEIADELDSLTESFRSIDLLITLDAVGFSHDIIPQNVKNHLNVFGEKSYFLSDGPHVARRDEKTLVRNILSPLDHTDIDDDKEIQFEIIELINQTVGKKSKEGPKDLGPG